MHIKDVCSLIFFWKLGIQSRVVQQKSGPWRWARSDGEPRAKENLWLPIEELKICVCEPSLRSFSDMKQAGGVKAQKSLSMKQIYLFFWAMEEDA